MKPQKEVGIVTYGAYIPRYRIKASEIARVWRSGQENAFLPIQQKSVPGPDEDAITMAAEAALNGFGRNLTLDRKKIGAVWMGSESHPYAVKPSGTVLAQMLDITPQTLAGDFEFACKAGTEAMQAGLAFVGSGMGDFALCIGSDTAQGKPGDALEYTAAAGAAAFVIGPSRDAIAILEASYSYVSDTPDFFRRAYQHYPEHGNRFTGDLAYFHHIREAVKRLLKILNREPQHYQYVIFHQPNVKFPSKLASELGFTKEQLSSGLLVNKIGNTYSAAALLGFTAVLDVAQPGDKILLASFGSGAGSDAFSFKVTPKIKTLRKNVLATRDYVQRVHWIDYALYARWRKKIRMS